MTVKIEHHSQISAMILVTISMQILPNEVSCLVSKGGLSGLIISTAEDLREFGGFDQMK